MVPLRVDPGRWRIDPVGVAIVVLRVHSAASLRVGAEPAALVRGEHAEVRLVEVRLRVASVQARKPVVVHAPRHGPLLSPRVMQHVLPHRPCLVRGRLAGPQVVSADEVGVVVLIYPEATFSKEHKLAGHCQPLAFMCCLSLSFWPIIVCTTSILT